jgi:hypothetical protein
MAAFRKQEKPASASEKVKKERVAARKSGTIKRSKRSKGGAFVLIVGDEGAILVYLQGAKVSRRLLAPSPQQGHTEAMIELMSSNPSVPLYVLADVMDQQYIPHTFPPVSSLSVGGIVKRRMDRDFQPDDLKAALRLGRDKTGRKEWRYLLVALAKTPLFTEWLDRLLELPNELKGIYLAPVESMQYMAAIHKKIVGTPPKPWQLFISHNKVSGFRQVVTYNGRLVFTRVSQAIDDAIPAVIAGNVEQEIINTIEYLKRLEYRDSGDLEAFVIASQDVLDSMDLKRFNFARADSLTPMGVADLLGLEQAALSADRFGDVVMAAAFGLTKKRLLRFSNGYIERLSKLYKAQQGVKFGSIGLALVLLALAAKAALAIASDMSAAEVAKSKDRTLQPEIEVMRKRVSGLGEGLAFKSALVATHDIFLKSTPMPEDLVTGLAGVTSPEARVTRMEWVYTDPNDKAAGGSSGTPSGGEALPLTVKLKVDFSGSGGQVDQVMRAAKDFTQNLQKSLPRYEVTNEPFSWEKEQAQQEQISLNASPETTRVQDPTGTFTLRGLKKEGASAAGGTQ